MPLIVPYFAVGSGDEITIDGVTYKVPRVDAAGRVYVNPYVVGASEVKAARVITVSPSTTRVTLATPAAGKKIRVLSCQGLNNDVTRARLEVYFGAGADITTNAGKEIADFSLDADVQLTFAMCWPDGAGPVGAANDVVSLRTDANIAANAVVVVIYREE